MSRTGRDLPPRAAVVIIGGGVIGVSTAYHLAAAGVRDVVLVDRAAFGSGSTCKAAGGVRAQFSDRTNIELGRRSLWTFEHFREQLDQEIDLHQVGYLFLLDSPDHVRGVRAERRAAERAGRAEPDALGGRGQAPVSAHRHRRARSPPRTAPPTGTARRSRWSWGTPPRPAGTVRGSSPHCAATGIETRDGRVVAVDHGRRQDRDRHRRLRHRGVVPRGRRRGWASTFRSTPLRRQILVTEPVPGLDPETPFTIDFGTSFYFHGEGDGLLLGMSDPHETPGFALGRSDDWLPGLGEAMERRTPALAEVGIASGWAGLYEMTPDHNALIGEAGSVSRFLYATGFSGHGFLMGPAVGEVMRDLYLGRRPCVDVSGLDARRFTASETRPELNIV